jgi:Uroporphyrinogen decarboxylase (URO-D)
VTDDAVIDVLSGRARVAPVGVTWLPEHALDALFWGKASGPAEALGALAQNVPLDFAFVPADAVWAEEGVAEIRRSDSQPVWAIAGPLGRVEARLGALETLRMSAAEPADLAAIIDRELHAALDEARRAGELGVRVLVVADDLAGDEGPLVSPDYALEALMPCYRRLAQQASELEIVPLFHSDGDVRTLVPALARAGYAAIHAGGVSASRLAAVAEVAWANGLAMVGGLHAKNLLAATRDEAASAVSLARRGAMLVCDDGGIGSAEELAAFVTAARAVRSSLAQSSS